MYRNLLLVLHIIAVSAWLGANFVQIVVAPRMARVGGSTHLAWLSTSRMLGQRYYNVAGVLLGVTGVLLVIETPYEFSAGFVAVGLSTIVVGALLGVFGFERWTKRQMLALESSPPDEPVATRMAQRVLVGALFDSALVILAIVTMVVKWRA